MPKTHVQVSVNFTQAPPTCNPDPVPVSRASNDGIQWQATQTGYSFTGVTIDGTTYTPASNGDGEFKDVTITTNAADKSIMNITDTVSDTNDHTYAVNYSHNGTDYSFDPTIRNEN